VLGIEAAGGRCGGARSVGSSAAPEEEVEMAWRSWRHVDAAGEGTDGLLGSEHGHDEGGRCWYVAGVQTSRVVVTIFHASLASDAQGSRLGAATDNGVRLHYQLWRCHTGGVGSRIHCRGEL
jgi:hypothetical protein